MKGTDPGFTRALTATITALLLTSLFLSGTVIAAQETHTADSASNSNTETARMPESVIITGQQSIRNLEIQFSNAEDFMYDMFNELNDDRRYDVHCYKEAPTGTKISQRICKPQFLIDSTTNNAKASLAEMQGMSAVRVTPVHSELQYRYPILEEKMAMLAREHPEFNDAIIHRYELSEELRLRKSTSLQVSE